MKMNMHAVRFIDKNRHIERMCELYNAAQVSCHTEVCRIYDKQAFCVRVFRQSPLGGLKRNAVRNSELIVNFRVYKNRHRSGKYNGRHNGFMNVSRNDDFISGSAYGHDHRHNGAARPLYGKEGMVCAECFRGQILGFFNDALWRM
ncbi:Uncharacterised protein [Streptococcus pneumoniae]|nr:Uncharacterised protein [Streptococcus pneumoniae]